MIFLKQNCLDIKAYTDTYKPNDKGEVKLEVIANLFKIKPDQVLDFIQNSPDFYVINPSNNGDKSSQKDGDKTAQ